MTHPSLINSEIGLRYAVDIAATFILIRGIYFSNYKRSDLFLTFFSFNTVIFFISYMLNRVDMSIGSAFGLFAVFSMLRYRTSGISTKDMTYLFLCITLGMLNAVAPADFLSLSLVSAILLLLIFVLETKWIVKKEQVNTIVYDNVQLIQAGREAELLTDLQHRTGFTIHRYEVSEIDFLKDTCVLTVYSY
ncbi:MAG: DUF4956 domain-containing protein [Sphingobacteriaceae bacterium]